MTITLPSLLFFLPVYLVFCILRKELRIYWLSFASLFYVFMLNRYAACALLLTAGLTWLFGLVIGRFHKCSRVHVGKFLTIIAIVIAVLALAALKYAPVLTEKQQTNGSVAERLIIPLGFSFYIFEAISYFVDIHMNRTQAEADPFRLFLYLAWFPKFISGPIERNAKFRQEVDHVAEVKLFDTDRLCRALCYAVIGVFLKIMVADRLSPYVSYIYIHNDGFSTTWLALGSFFYTLQIYTDFAGYSLLAIGISLFFGLSLSDNFMAPYLSENITDFWRRWHMTLSSWLRDYLYIPLGGSRSGYVRRIFNTFIVFVLCGIWHGAGLTFIIWGLLHGLYSALDFVLRTKGLQILRKGIIGHILTFTAVSFAWIFFRADTIQQAIAFLRNMSVAGLRLHSFTAEREVLGLEAIDFVILVCALLFVLVVDVITSKKNRPFPETLAEAPQALRWALICILVLSVLIFGAYGPSYDSSMIYMNF